MVVRALEGDGFDKVTCDVLVQAMDDPTITTFEDLVARSATLTGSLPPERSSRLKSAIEHLTKTRNHNTTVYDAVTPADYKARYWPNNAKLRQTNWELFEDLHQADIMVSADRFITKQTAITSAGSCFAANISRQLQHWGYNYIVEMQQQRRNSHHAGTYSTDPAACGNIYNAVAMRQMVERAFGEWTPPNILVTSKTGYLDPFRAYTDFSSVAEYLEKSEQHTAALGRALRRSEVFVLTLGMTEAWFIGGTDLASSTSPRRCDPTLFRHKNLSVDDNVRELERIHALFKKHNPNCKLITTVSPVPLNATFNRDRHVVVANGLSKATLRVALEEFSNRHPENVYYFPAYEIVTTATRSPWDIDLRHVSNEAVARVMGQFQRMFMVDQSPLDVLPLTEISEFIPQRRNYPLRYARQFVVHPIKRALGIEGRGFRTLWKRDTAN